jgi:hypothetical protein
MAPQTVCSAQALMLTSVLTANTAAAQLMSTCVANSPERHGEIGCSIIESKVLPEGIESPRSGISIALILWRGRAQPSAQPAWRSTRPEHRGS